MKSSAPASSLLSRLTVALLAGLLVASCVDDRTSDSTAIGALAGGGLSATLSLSSDWGTGYCANISLTNTGTAVTTSWQVVINLNQSTASAPWNATVTTSGSQMTDGPLSWNAAIAPGATASYGFCATATGTNYRPTLVSVSGSGNGGATTGSAGATGAAGAVGAAGAGGGRAGAGGAAGGRAGAPGTAGATGAGGKLGAAGTSGAAGAGGRAVGGAGSTGAAGTTGGLAGSTGKAGSTGSTGAAGTSGGTQCTLPSTWTPNNGTGSFTWYYFSQGTGSDDLGYRTACGYIGQEPSGTGSDTVDNIATPGYFAAVPGTGNFSTVDHCGACAQITNGSKSVIVTIVDECPAASNPACAGTANASEHLDLSVPAFNALGYSNGDPSGTTWKYVPCPVTGGIVVRVKEGNSNQVYIENVVLPIAKVTVNGGAATHLAYGAWQLPGNAAVGQTLTLTDAAGRVTSVQIASTSTSSNVSTGTQEPVCQ
jgi:hypothetical protein